jgi:hypothetical protein
MHHAPGAVVALAIVLAAASSSAQEQPPAAPQPSSTISLRPIDPARWDAAVTIGWVSANRGDVAEEWDDWSDAASFDVSAGRYWTPHVKLEVALARTTEGRVFTQEPVAVPGQPFPIFISREHYLRSISATAGLSYQFFENTWFHPFVAAGVEAGRERSRIRLPAQFVPGRFPGAPATLMPEQIEEETAGFARPFAMAGFKWYVAERAFIRSDLRASASADGVESAVLRAGLGFDF